MSFFTAPAEGRSTGHPGARCKPRRRFCPSRGLLRRCGGGRGALRGCSAPVRSEVALGGGRGAAALGRRRRGAAAQSCAAAEPPPPSMAPSTKIDLFVFIYFYFCLSLRIPAGGGEECASRKAAGCSPSFRSRGFYAQPAPAALAPHPFFQLRSAAGPGQLPPGAKPGTSAPFLNYFRKRAITPTALSETKCTGTTCVVCLK